MDSAIIYEPINPLYTNNIDNKFIERKINNNNDFYLFFKYKHKYK